jgi:hypothetical protein
LATLAAALASMQNPPLVLLALALAMEGVRAGSRERDRGASARAAMALLPAFVPCLFCLWQFGTPSLLSRGAASATNLSLGKTLELFFDPKRRTASLCARGRGRLPVRGDPRRRPEPRMGPVPRDGVSLHRHLQLEQRNLGTRALHGVDLSLIGLRLRPSGPRRVATRSIRRNPGRRRDRLPDPADRESRRNGAACRLPAAFGGRAISPGPVAVPLQPELRDLRRAHDNGAKKPFPGGAPILYRARGQCRKALAAEAAPRARCSRSVGTTPRTWPSCGGA